MLGLEFDGYVHVHGHVHRLSLDSEAQMVFLFYLGSGHLIHSGCGGGGVGGFMKIWVAMCKKIFNPPQGHKNNFNPLPGDAK